MIERKYWGNGNIKSEVPINHQEQKHGISKWWWDNGHLYYEIPYYQGQEHGIGKWWYSNGQLRYKDYYLYGHQTTYKEYRHHELVEKLSGL